MAGFSTSFDMFSPRSGLMDRYCVDFDVHRLHITQGSFSATCSHVDDGTPCWSGYGGNMGNPIMRKFEHDAIYAPAALPEVIEWAWEQWREGEISSEELRTALEQVFAWVDRMSRAGPSSEFLSRYFCTDSGMPPHADDATSPARKNSEVRPARSVPVSTATRPCTIPEE